MSQPEASSRTHVDPPLFTTNPYAFPSSLITESPLQSQLKVQLALCSLRSSDSQSAVPLGTHVGQVLFNIYHHAILASCIAENVQQNELVV